MLDHKIPCTIRIHICIACHFIAQSVSQSAAHHTKDLCSLHLWLFFFSSLSIRYMRRRRTRIYALGVEFLHHLTCDALSRYVGLCLCVSFLLLFIRSHESVPNRFANKNLKKKKINKNVNIFEFCNCGFHHIAIEQPPFDNRHTHLPIDEIVGIYRNAHFGPTHTRLNMA